MKRSAVKRNKISATLIGGAILATAAFAGSAQAVPVSTTISKLNVGPGFSQSNQASGSLENADGAKVSVDFSFTRTATQAGKLTVTLTNTGAIGSNVENFGLSLRDDIFGAPGATGITEASTFKTAMSCVVDGCDGYQNGVSNNLQSFMNNHIQVGAVGGQGKKGVGRDGSSMETITFNWDIAFTAAQAAVLDTVTSFMDLVSIQAAHGVTGTAFNTFWAVHVQGLKNGRSTRLGGNSDLPEPSTMALLALGVLGLGVLVRRRAA
jgi:hypothetical protein